MKSEQGPKDNNMREADAEKSLTHTRPEPKTKPPTKRPTSSSNHGSEKDSK